MKSDCFSHERTVLFTSAVHYTVHCTNELLLHIKLNMHCPMYWVFPFAHACSHGGGLENEIRGSIHGTWARTRIVDIIQIFKLFRTFQSWTFHAVCVQWLTVLPHRALWSVHKVMYHYQSTGHPDCRAT